MNERIKELAGQARKYARDYVAECRHYGHYMEHNEYELRFAEKFAELIVRECASMARVYRSHEFDFTGDLELDEFMLKHFGVEE